MSCSFTLGHYREILESALQAGYVFEGFHHQISSSQASQIYLRHDIDVCPEEALDMAILEAELGVRATYFVLVNSPLYNLLSKDSLELIHQINSRGHWIGLHVDVPLLKSSDLVQVENQISKFIDFYAAYLPLIPVVSFHRPHVDVLGHEFTHFISTYSPRFFNKIKYISDSRGVWREGCPCEALKQRAYPALQILVHPIWWLLKEETLSQKLQRLLGKRFAHFKHYLGENIEPLGRLLQEGKQ